MALPCAGSLRPASWAHRKRGGDETAFRKPTKIQIRQHPQHRTKRWRLNAAGALANVRLLASRGEGDTAQSLSRLGAAKCGKALRGRKSGGIYIVGNHDELIRIRS